MKVYSNNVSVMVLSTQCGNLMIFLLLRCRSSECWFWYVSTLENCNHLPKSKFWGFQNGQIGSFSDSKCQKNSKIVTLCSRNLSSSLTFTVYTWKRLLLCQTLHEREKSSGTRKVLFLKEKITKRSGYVYNRKPNQLWKYSYGQKTWNANIF